MRRNRAIWYFHRNETWTTLKCLHNPLICHPFFITTKNNCFWSLIFEKMSLYGNNNRTRLLIHQVVEVLLLFLLVFPTVYRNLLIEWLVCNANFNDYDRLTDWIRPLACGLAIYSLTDSWKPNLPRVKLDVLFSHSISTLYNSLWYSA
jgi:hypothetical protein